MTAARRSGSVLASRAGAAASGISPSRTKGPTFSPAKIARSAAQGESNSFWGVLGFR